MASDAKKKWPRWMIVASGALGVTERAISYLSGSQFENAGRTVENIKAWWPLIHNWSAIICASGVVIGGTAWLLESMPDLAGVIKNKLRKRRINHRPIFSDAPSAAPTEPPKLLPAKDLTVGSNLKWYSCGCNRVSAERIHFRAVDSQEAAMIYKKLNGIQSKDMQVAVCSAPNHKPSATDLERDGHAERVRRDNMAAR